MPVALTRHHHDVVRRRFAARAHRRMLRVLIRRKHLRQQRAQLHLAPHAQRLRAAQRAAELIHAARQGLHGIQAAGHLLEPARHLRKRRLQPLIDRRAELFVNRQAHLLKLTAVVLADARQPALERLAHALHALLVAGELVIERLAHAAQAFLVAAQPAVHRLADALHALLLLAACRAHLPAEGIHLALLRARHLAHHPHDAVVHRLHRLAVFALRLLARLARPRVRLRQLLRDLPAHFAHAFLRLLRAAVQKHQRDQHQQHQQKAQQEHRLLRAHARNRFAGPRQHFHKFTLRILPAVAHGMQSML